MSNLTDATLTDVPESPYVSTTSQVIEVIILCCIIVVSILGNASLWIVVLRSRALRTLTSMFILGLSMADLCVAAINMPVTVYTIIVGRWTLSNDACIATGYINMLTLVTSVLSLCNISINRYFMVCHPAKFKDIYTPRNALLMITAVVLCSALLSLPPLVGWSEYVYTPTHSFCFADWANHMSYSFFMIGCCFGVPFGVMSVCNVLIIRSVRHSRMRVKSNLRKSQTSTAYSSGIYGKSVPKFEDNSCYETSYVEPIKKIKPVEIKVAPAQNSVDNITTTKHSNSDNNHNTNPPSATNLELPDDASSKSDISQLKSTLDRLSDASETDINSCLITHKAVDKVSIEKVHLRKLALTKEGVKDSNAIKANARPAPKDHTLLHPAWQSDNEDVTSTITVTVESSSEMTINIDHPSASAESSTEPVQRRKRGSPLLRRREEIRLAFSLVVVVVIFVICWLPYCISMLISIFYKGVVPREFHMFTLVIGYANSGCNPIVYGVMNKRFKVGFKRLFCFWKQTELSFSST